ncbi:MAG: hypothetical protein AAGF92_14590 [Myxococcota bacterium]
MTTLLTRPDPKKVELIKRSTANLPAVVKEAELAEFWGCHRRRIRELLSEGRLVGFKRRERGSPICILTESVRDFMLENSL